MKRPHRILMVLLLLVTVGCARVPKEAVTLSDTIGKDLVATRTAHNAIVRQHFGAMRQNVNAFVDYTYRPFILKKTMEDLDLVTQIQAAASGRHELGLDALDLMEIYVEEAISQIESFRAEMLAPISQQEATVLANLDLTYGAMINANAIITAHLRSVIKVHEAQQEALSAVGVDEDLRKTISGEVAAFSGQINELLSEARNADKKHLEELPSKLQKLVEKFKKKDK